MKLQVSEGTGDQVKEIPWNVTPIWLPFPFDIFIVWSLIKMTIEVPVDVWARTWRVVWLRIIPHPSSIKDITFLIKTRSRCSRLRIVSNFDSVA